MEQIKQPLDNVACGDVPEASRQPIYQVQFHTESGSSAWHDASEAAYHTFMPDRRRIVYVSPENYCMGMDCVCDGWCLDGKKEAV